MTQFYIFIYQLFQFGKMASYFVTIFAIKLNQTLKKIILFSQDN